MVTGLGGLHRLSLDRRYQVEVRSALDKIREAEREPLIRALREANEEIRRLQRLVDEQHALLQDADCATGA